MRQTAFVKASSGTGGAFFLTQSTVFISEESNFSRSPPTIRLTPVYIYSLQNQQSIQIIKIHRALMRLSTLDFPQYLCIQGHNFHFLHVIWKMSTFVEAFRPVVFFFFFLRHLWPSHKGQTAAFVPRIWKPCAELIRPESTILFLISVI